VVPHRLRVGEGQPEGRCDHQTHECALDERSTHCRSLIAAEAVRKGFRQRLHAFRAQEKKLQVQPDLAMMARLEDEMTFPLRKELRNLLLHLPAL
jgi:hypothetical protein